MISYYTLDKILPIDLCDKITCYKGPFIRLWSLKNISVWANHLAYYYQASLADIGEVRRKVISTKGCIIHRIEHPFLIHKFDAGDWYDWHNDLDQRPGIESIRRVTVIVKLNDFKFPITVKTERAEFMLQEKGTGVIIPATDKYKIKNADRGQNWLATIWGLENLVRSISVLGR